jgi:MoaA/NifB/PqqE/SkfB family radical SAM enzyme
MVFKWLDFKITNRCNNNCLYCSNQDPLEYSEKIPSETIRNSISDALELSFTHFAFLGGEPSIRENVEQLFTPLHKHGNDVYCVMAITNMHFFNEQLYHSIFKSKSRLAQIVASIDSLKEPNYKNQNTVQTLQYLDQIQEIANHYSGYGQREIHIHSVISRENLHNVYDHVMFFLKKNIQVSLAIVEPHLLTENPTRYNEFSQKEINIIVNQLKKLETEGNLNWANKVLLNYIITYIIDGRKEGFKCTAGKKHVIIESDGYVYPCLTESYRRGLKYGNILNESFHTIYDNMKEFMCESAHHQTCWDHYLWTELDKLG